ncbi:hypothetical protein KC980_01380, partial [candidate division WWE3 bacterium]|nr:hypothetical protein [candidate division WWE3 bacterium]
MPQYDETKLLTSLKEIGVIDAAKLDQIFEQSKRAQISFEAALIKSNLITDKNLGQTVAEILNTPFVHLADETLDDSVVTMLPASYAKKHLIIPYKLENGNVLLATNNPQNSLLLSLVKQKLDSNIQVKYATQLDLENTFSIYKKDL